MFAKYPKSFEDIKGDIPFTSMVINPQFVTFQSPENLIINIHSVFSVGWDERLGTHKGLNITSESQVSCLLIFDCSLFIIQ